MIPEGINISDLTTQLLDDGVAFVHDDPELHAQLVASREQSPALHNAGFVVLNFTPAQPADLRDIAQELLLSTDLSTIVVRSPDSGAIVSNAYSRAHLESAQHAFLSTPTIEAGVANLNQELETSPAVGGTLTLILASVIFLVSIALTLVKVKRTD
ncbi:MAG: hypothetical protein Q4A31_00590 [Corynebacterium sp.]|uniref:Rv1476 family membrane protein n=1 Tax=Corynebacterium sp. TaxID=1720 RepID=UPI0026DC8C49|nr:DUF6676 family protein [Corynebacterium sp.]MDO4760406.1 hypothetical protein [Corynebacterium sp.]